MVNSGAEPSGGVTIALADAYLYGSRVRTLELTDEQLILEVEYPQEDPDFVDLEVEEHLNLLRARLVFSETDSSAPPGDESLRQLDDLRAGWDSQPIWRVIGVVPHEETGFVLELNAGEFYLPAATCEVVVLESIEDALPKSTWFYSATSQDC